MLRTICLFAFTTILTAPAALNAADGKPNVLFLFADDMRADSLGALGDKTVKTPHLDTVVQRGFVFRNAYCLGGNSPAVCLPSRNMLLSGNAYFRWKNVTTEAGRPGMYAPGDRPNFPLSLQDAGYETYHHGKKGNTAPPIESKFQTHKYLKNDQAERQSGEPGQEIVDDAIAFLQDRQRDKPFFMYLAFGNPHDPRVAAPKYLQQYDAATIPLMKNYLPVHPFNNGEMVVRDEQLLPWPRTEAGVRQTLHEYYATITAMDFHIGRLLKRLDDLRLTDDTLIVFSADQGISIGSHGLLGKQNLYDHATKSPLVFAGPGIPQGHSDALIYLLDIYPTVCDLVGAPLPQGIDGISAKSLIEGKTKSLRPELFFSYMAVQRAIRDDRWKLIRYPQVNVTQLFDLQHDPDELHNLAAEPAQAGRVRDMLTRLKSLQQHFGDDLPLTVENPQPAAWTPPKLGDLPKAKARKAS